MKIKLNIKSVLVLTILAIMMTSISLFFINTSFAANTATVNVETANIREAADTNATILELVNKGESVEILETSGEWSKVKYKNIVGYLRNDLLDSNTPVEENKTENQTVTSAEIAPETPVTTDVTETQTSNTLGKYKVKQDAKLKTIPLIHAMDMGDVAKDTELDVINIINKWACVKTQDKQGWLPLEQLEKIAEPEPTPEPEQEEPAQTKTMYVNSESVNVRSSADRSAEVITSLVMNDQVEVIGEENGWSKVNVSGSQGYILSSLLSNRKQETSRSLEKPRTAETTQTKAAETPATSSDTSKGNSIVEYAKQFIGTPYKYGGTTPAGFDCSGFTQYVYAHFGISLPRTSGGQASVGTAVKGKSNLQPGDLVIYSGHVAIYVGGGNVIHSPKPGKSICIVSINNAGSGYSGGRRLV